MNTTVFVFLIIALIVIIIISWGILEWYRNKWHETSNYLKEAHKRLDQYQKEVRERFIRKHPRKYIRGDRFGDWAIKEFVHELDGITPPFFDWKYRCINFTTQEEKVWAERDIDLFNKPKSETKETSTTAIDTEGDWARWEWPYGGGTQSGSAESKKEITLQEVMNYALLRGWISSLQFVLNKDSRAYKDKIKWYNHLYSGMKMPWYKSQEKFTYFFNDPLTEKEKDFLEKTKDLTGNFDLKTQANQMFRSILDVAKEALDNGWIDLYKYIYVNKYTKEWQEEFNKCVSVNPDGYMTKEWFQDFFKRSTANNLGKNNTSDKSSYASKMQKVFDDLRSRSDFSFPDHKFKTADWDAEKRNWDNYTAKYGIHEFKVDQSDCVECRIYWRRFDNDPPKKEGFYLVGCEDTRSGSDDKFCMSAMFHKSTFVLGKLVESAGIKVILWAEEPAIPQKWYNKEKLIYEPI